MLHTWSGLNRCAEPGGRVANSEQRLLVRVALLYYEENRTQEEIASLLALSRSKVVRLLQEARRRGIVQIRVLAPHASHRGLAQGLEQRYGLARAVVAGPAQSQPSADQVRLAVAHEAAEVLTELLTPGLVVAMASGSTMAAVVDAMPVVHVPNLKVVEMQGLIMRGDYLDSRHVVARMAQRLGAEYHVLPVPREVGSAELAAALLVDVHIRQELELARSADVLFVGIGAMVPLSATVSHLPPEVVEQLQDLGAIGEIGARFFDSDGRPCMSHLEKRLIGVQLTDVLHIPTRIGVAFGKHKVAAIAGAVAGRYVNTLITDVDTANGLLEYLRPEPTPVMHATGQAPHAASLLASTSGGHS